METEQIELYAFLLKFVFLMYLMKSKEFMTEL